MKIWVLAGLFTVVTAPLAAANTTSSECQVDDTRRRLERVAVDPESGSTPSAVATAQPVVRPPVIAPPRETVAAAAPNDRVQTPQRRRSGKRIPDAELIGPRGAL